MRRFFLGFARPKKNSSFLNQLKASKTPHKELSQGDVGASLKLKTRVVKKLCQLAGGGTDVDTRDFVLRRVLQPSWKWASEFFDLLRPVSDKSSSRKIALKLISDISYKVTLDNKQDAARILLNAARRASPELVTKSFNLEKVVRSIATLYNEISKNAKNSTDSKPDAKDGKSGKSSKAVKRRQSTTKLLFASQIASCIKPHLEEKIVKELGFRMH